MRMLSLKHWSNSSPRNATSNTGQCKNCSPARDACRAAIIRRSTGVRPYRQVIAISPDVRFYGYAVCDILGPLRDIIEDTHRMHHTPDGIGYYVFNEKLNLVIEVIPYSKIVADAERRNAAFFRKLNM